MDKLEETDEFYEKYNLSRVRQEEIEKMNTSITKNVKNHDTVGASINSVWDMINWDLVFVCITLHHFRL